MLRETFLSSYHFCVEKRNFFTIERFLCFSYIFLFESFKCQTKLEESLFVSVKKKRLDHNANRKLFTCEKSFDLICFGCEHRHETLETQLTKFWPSWKSEPANVELRQQPFYALTQTWKSETLTLTLMLILRLKLYKKVSDASRKSVCTQDKTQCEKTIFSKSLFFLYGKT